MRHLPQAELLTAMKDGLSNLENTKLLSPDDIQLLSLKRHLREKIAELEERLAEGEEQHHGMAAD